MRSDVGFPIGFGDEAASVLPGDLLAAVLVTAVADAVALVGLGGTLGVSAASALLFFLPGYAIVAALYPGASPEAGDEQSGIDLLERLALSFGVSVAATVFLGLAIYRIAAATGARGPSTATTLAVVTLVIAVGVAVAAVRRLRRPPQDRFAPPYGEWVERIRAALFRGARTDRLLNVVLAISVLLGMGVLGYAVATPPDGERYTTASLLTEGEDGELVASGYPDQLAPGESAELVLELGNHERADTAYTVVVRIERVDTAGDDGGVTEASELDRLSVSVPAGETRTVAHAVEPGMTGEDLRLSYYVYRGEAPSEPDAATAYRHLYVWVSVG